VTQLAVVDGGLGGPLSAAKGVSGQLTGSSGGSGLVSSVVPANVVWYWTYCFVPFGDCW
jgi:hypothetical protein